MVAGEAIQWAGWDQLFCKNCGHQSHCGKEHKMDATNGRGKFLGEVVICKHCRCGKCTRPDWGQEKKMAECTNEYCVNPACDCDPCECTADSQCVCCEGWDGE